MGFSDETNGLIQAAEDARDAAVEARRVAQQDAQSAATAAATAKESEGARAKAYQDAATAKGAAVKAIDGELSIPQADAESRGNTATPAMASAAKRR